MKLRFKEIVRAFFESVCEYLHWVLIAYLIGKLLR